ncbi:lysophospholipid acyltransferase family protein [soil metagenome]
MLKDVGIFDEIAPGHAAEASDVQQDGSSPAPTSTAARFASRIRSVSSLVVRGYLSTYHRLEIVGRGRLPARGPFMMVSNHSSHLDAICLRAALPRQQLAASFTAVAEDYFMASAFRRMAAKIFANAVPFSRDVRVRGGMRRCLSLLSGDNAVLIFFPEGTRTTTGAMSAFRPGIGALLAGSSLPVVPCAIVGAFEAWPKGQRIARPRAIRVTIGQPRTYAAFPRNHQSHRAVSDDLRSAVEAMLCK